MEIVQVATRIDAQLAEALAEIATKEKRSLSAQIALILEQYLEKVEGITPAKD